METMAEYLAELVKAGLEDRKAASLPEGVSVREIVKISEENHMDYLLLGALLKTDGLSEEEKELLREKVLGSMLFTGMQLQELKKLEERMEQAKIPCQPMKGARMKFYYPSSFLREMSDIDILIHGDFMEQAAVELEAMGYVLQQKIKHHDIYRKAPGIVVEAHRAMYDRTVDERQYAYFSDLSRAVRRKGFLYVYDFEAEDFYIYMMAHMAKHFYHSLSCKNALPYDGSYGKAFLQERLWYPESGGHLCVSGKIRWGNERRLSAKAVCGIGTDGIYGAYGEAGPDLAAGRAR